MKKLDLVILIAVFSLLTCGLLGIFGLAGLHISPLLGFIVAAFTSGLIVIFSKDIILRRWKEFLIASTLLASSILIPTAGTLDSQGPNSPDSVVNASGSGGSVEWKDPSYAKSSDDKHAKATASPTGGYTVYLKATDFGFSIPSGATINGIKVEIERHANYNTDKIWVKDWKVYLLKNGNTVGDNKADTATKWPTSDAYKTYGGSSDLWGTSWSPSDINNANFGVVLAVQMSTGTVPPSEAYVDHIRITVYYTTGGDTTPPSITINYAGNLGDSGGPLYIPPNEDGTEASDGYYTNDSYQSETFIYINCTVTDDTEVSSVYLHLYDVNTSTWDNSSSLTNSGGNYWEINKTGLTSGHKYTFDIYAEDSSGNSKLVYWNKTGIGGDTVRRYVSLGCSEYNLSYKPLYFYNASYTSDDTDKPDRLHHDQGPNGSVQDTGYLLLDVPTDEVSERVCSAFVGYFFDDNICVQPMTLSNIYYHFWWNCNTDQLGDIGFKKTRGCLTNQNLDESTSSSGVKRSNITWNGKVYSLETKLLEFDNSYDFTDNDIYELSIVINSAGGAVLYFGIISNRSFTSFILLNVPDNDTLDDLDSDDDGLNDYQELYVTFTNPFLIDTDGDGYSDYSEYTHNSDPNNYTDTPPPSPPTITLNFAGNLSDLGGPYYRPPTETDVLDEPAEGEWRDGYYTANSRQKEDWIYINCTIESTSSITHVWLNWLNETTWTNWTYELTHTAGSYWEINTSGIIDVAPGYDYSFDIVANNSAGYSTTFKWRRVVLGGGYERRYVQLGCQPTDLNYTIYYLYRPFTYSSSDYWKYDRLHHDQGTDGGGKDTGYLKNTVPSDAIEDITCAAFAGAFIDADLTINKTRLDNVYQHVWWKDDDYSASIQWGKSRTKVSGGLGNKVVDASNAKSSIVVDGAEYKLWAGLNPRVGREVNVSDNSIYELVGIFISGDNPKIISNRSFTSFVIINVPDNTTLQNMDSDNDGLNDYQELYVTFTNPFLSDTDNDGFDDYFEYQHQSDPNNYTDWTTNSPPELTNPSASPSSGITDYTTFYFNITYSDSDGDPPVEIKVNITKPGWYLNASMNYVSGDNTTGALYSYSTMLKAGIYDILFYACDGEGKAVNDPDIHVKSTFRMVVRADGEDYFIWVGKNCTASEAVEDIPGFDEASEYIAIWNGTTWDSENGLWIFYYGDGTGEDFYIHTYDVIRIYLTDTGTVDIYATPNNYINYSATRTVLLINSTNKGANYTGYTGSTTTLSDIVDDAGLEDGEVIGYWDNSTYEWEIYVVGFSDLNVEIDKFTVVYTKVGDTRTWNIPGPEA